MQNDMSTALMWSKSKPDVEFQYGGRLGEFNGMSSQSHVSHCRVLPLDEINCHDRATLQGVRIPSAIFKIVFRHILLWTPAQRSLSKVYYILPMFFLIFYGRLILRPWLTEVRESFTRGGP